MAGSKGYVAQIIGTVVDIAFPPEELPALYNAVEIPLEGVTGPGPSPWEV